MRTRVMLLCAALVLVGTWLLWSANSSERHHQPAATDAVPAELTQFDLTRAETVFEGRGAEFWDQSIRERGWIMRSAEGYRMWYSGHSGDRSNIKLLGHATSSDGRNWQRTDAPLVPDQWIEDVMVIVHEGSYYMFAEGVGDQAQLWHSDDGLNWSSLGKIDLRLTNGEPIASGSYGTPTGFVEDNVWYLFYEREDLGIWVAQSTDLKVWTNLTDDPVILPGPESYDKRLIAMNQVIKRDGRYYAYYHGTGSTSKPADWCTALAVSDDLLHWQKYSGNPILPCDRDSASGILVTHGEDAEFYIMHNAVKRYPPK
ncbi:MAG: hypothetical protein AB8B93_17055 [Pseudomonadales bacterium]